MAVSDVTVFGRTVRAAGEPSGRERDGRPDDQHLARLGRTFVVAAVTAAVHVEAAPGFAATYPAADDVSSQVRVLARVLRWAPAVAVNANGRSCPSRACPWRPGLSIRRPTSRPKAGGVEAAERGCGRLDRDEWTASWSAGQGAGVATCTRSRRRPPRASRRNCLA